MQFPPVSREAANKSVIFFTPLTDNITTRMVRTGTIADGSCFFHAVCHACSPAYVQANIQERQKQVNTLRASISSNVNKIGWITEENISSVVMFQEAFHNNLENAYNHFTNTKRDSYLENLLKEFSPYYTVLVELIPFSVFENKILPSAYADVKNIIDCKEGVVTVYDKYIGEIKEVKKLERHKRIKALSAFTTFVITLLNDTEERVFQHYINSLKLPADIDTYTIQAISDKLDLDIYFLDGHTRAPYRNASYSNLKKRRSIIVLWVDRNHYEIIGELLPDNRVKRIFDFKDEIIQKIYCLLCDPDTVRLKYPDLVMYLPKEDQMTVQQVSLSPSKQPPPSPTPKEISDKGSQTQHSNESDDSGSDESSKKYASSSSDSSSDSDRRHKHRKHRHKARSYRSSSSESSKTSSDSETTTDDDKEIVVPKVEVTKKGRVKDPSKGKPKSIKQNIEELETILKTPSKQA